MNALCSLTSAMGGLSASGALAGRPAACLTGPTAPPGL